VSLRLNAARRHEAEARVAVLAGSSRRRAGGAFTYCVDGPPGPTCSPAGVVVLHGHGAGTA